MKSQNSNIWKLYKKKKNNQTIDYSIIFPWFEKAFKCSDTPRLVKTLIGFNVVLILSSINYIYWTPFHSLQTRDLSLYELTRISRANVIFVAPILCIAKLCCTVTDCNYITLMNPSALMFNRKWFQYRSFFSLTCDSLLQSYYKLIMINLIILSAFCIFTFF